MPIHLSNSSWVMVESPTLATAPAGTSLPQPDSAKRPRRTPARAVRDSVNARFIAKRRRRVANEIPASLRFVFRFGGDLENRLRGGDDRPEALIGLFWEPYSHRLAARFVHGVRHALAQRLRAGRVELDGSDRHALAGEADRARARPPQLDARVLEVNEVVERRRDR